MIRAGLSSAVLTFLLSKSSGQVIDPNDPDDAVDGPTFTFEVDGVTKKGGIMLDAQWRYLHSPDGNCGQSANASFNEKCILEGLDAAGYADKYGISVDSDTNAITLEYATLPSSYSPAYPTYGTRSIVTDLSGDGGYASFDLLGKELTFTVDLSEVPAGMNAAVYLVSMDPSGNLGAAYADGNSNEAGWKRGVGYCDAQCPTDLSFVQGAGFNAGNALQSCCPEMDILEANRFAAAMTPHPCLTDAATICDTGATDCVTTKACDGVGADLNPFRSKGPGNELFTLVDPSKPMTVTTRFLVDGDGDLEAIDQKFTTFPYTTTHRQDGESIAAQKKLYDEDDVFNNDYGGLQQMGAALKKGMVMIISIWTDSSANMNWLDACSVQTKQTYNCSENAAFDDPGMWAAAFDQDGAGAWRGPGDYFPSLSESYQNSSATFTNPAIPEGWRTQAKFNCDGEYPNLDCTNETYKMVISNIKVTSIDSTHASSQAHKSPAQHTDASSANAASPSVTSWQLSGGGVNHELEPQMLAAIKSKKDAKLRELRGKAHQPRGIH